MINLPIADLYSMDEILFGDEISDSDLQKCCYGNLLKFVDFSM